jgi:hypothetical protein
MFLLIPNVRLNRRQQRRTNAERSIPFLPFKPLPKPARGIGLQLLHNLCQSQRSRQPDEQMYMISSSTRSQNLEPEVVPDTDQISVKLFLQFNRNPITPLLGTEDAMHKVCSMRMRHTATLSPHEQDRASQVTNTSRKFRKREPPRANQDREDVAQSQRVAQATPFISPARKCGVSPKTKEPSRASDGIH